MEIVKSLIKILIFPGFGFLVIYALLTQWIDRKLYAQMQNRVGPPWFQPAADLLKLFAKETIIPARVDSFLFRVLPYIAFAGVVTSFMFIPVWSTQPMSSYPGDLVIVFYLLTIPTLVLSLAGWVSVTAYSIIGGIRCLTQLFSYEIPFFIAVLTPALILGTWNIAEISAALPTFLIHHPVYFIPVFIAFIVGIIALQGKLERKPFDIPDAETELVAGPFVEYSGRLFAIFRLSLDMELIVGVSLLNAIFLGGANPHFGLPAVFGFVFYLIKTLLIIFVLAYIKTSVARIRIDQMINFGWRVLAPASLLGMLLTIILRRGGLR